MKVTMTSQNNYSTLNSLADEKRHKTILKLLHNIEY